MSLFAGSESPAQHARFVECLLKALLRSEVRIVGLFLLLLQCVVLGV
jgi:hypothetical protein